MVQFTLPGLDNVDLTRKVLLTVLVTLSATDPQWYCTLCAVSRGFRKTIDSMLQDPKVLEQLTFLDCRQQKYLTRFQPALSRLTTITIVLDQGQSGLAYLPHLSSLQHLHIRGASPETLSTYLNSLKGQLDHVTTDCAMDIDIASTTAWPPKVTLLHFMGGACALFPMLVGAVRGSNIQEVEMGPTKDADAVDLFNKMIWKNPCSKTP